MKHIPFDFCDECGRKFPEHELVKSTSYWFCEECINPDDSDRWDQERAAEEAARRDDAREGFDEA